MRQCKLTLGFISAFNERVEPLMNGSVEAEGVELIPTYSHPAETFWRQLKFGEFEVAEMSMSSYLIARSQGADMIALPVFPSRRLFQTELSYHVDSGITKPEDLADKRLGVAEYQQTAALWIRGILEHDFGVSQYKIHWYMERSEEMSHGGATGFKPPPGISFNRIAPDKSLASTLLENEMDVAHVASPWVLQANTLDRSSRIGGQRRLEQNQTAFSRSHGRSARAFTRNMAFYPSITPTSSAATFIKNIPGLPSVFTPALSKPRRLPARKCWSESFRPRFSSGREYAAMTRDMIGDDPFPYGVKPNMAMLDTITRLFP